MPSLGASLPGGAGCLTNFQHPPGAEARSFMTSGLRPIRLATCEAPLATRRRRAEIAGFREIPGHGREPGDIELREGSVQVAKHLSRRVRLQRYQLEGPPRRRA